MKAKVETIGSIAKMYGINVKTMKSMIGLYPELEEKLKPFRDAKKVTLPPAIVACIYQVLGDPEGE